MALGKYPKVSLADARRRHREALEDEGRDPMAVRAERDRVERLGRAHRLEDVAREWIAQQEGRWSDGHRRTVVERLQHDVFAPRGALGDRLVGEIDAPEVLETLRRIDRLEEDRDRAGRMLVGKNRVDDLMLLEGGRYCVVLHGAGLERVESGGASPADRRATWSRGTHAWAGQSRPAPRRASAADQERSGMANAILIRTRPDASGSP